MTVNNSDYNTSRSTGPATNINVGPMERIVSVIGGTAAALLGLKRRDPVSILLGLLGGKLLYRGITGSSPTYRMMGINRAVGDSEASVSVPHGQGFRVEESVEVPCEAAVAYRFWRDFENLPHFMENLESVEMLSDTRSRWEARALPGIHAKWEAEIINDVVNELIAWRSLPNSNVSNAGTVRFIPQDDGSTRITVTLEYVPVAGPVGAAILKLFGNSPQQQLREDLHRFELLMALGGKDEVQEASEDSFPASDPPSFTSTTT